jgi:NAD(P)-dependent dehydrogenase (short-subunit alcohol dehydrogenase family)
VRFEIGRRCREDDRDADLAESLKISAVWDVVAEVITHDQTYSRSLRVRNMSERTMVGRTGRPDDITNAVAFLASPESGFVTAQVITVDGGRMDYIGHG